MPTTPKSLIDHFELNGNPEVPLNDQADDHDENANGYLSVDIDDANQNLITMVDADGDPVWLRARVVEFKNGTGAPTADRTITVPSTEQVKLLKNSTTAQNLIISAGAATLSLAAGSSVTVFVDASDNVVAAGSLGKRLLQEKVVSAVANIDLTIPATNQKDDYEVEFDLKLAADGQLFCRLSQAATFLFGGSDYSWGMHVLDCDDAPAETPIGDANDDEIHLTGPADGGAATSFIEGNLVLHRPHGTDNHKRVKFRASYILDTADTLMETQGSGRLKLNTTAVDGIQLLGRNVADGAGVNLTGTVRLWALAKS